MVEIAVVGTKLDFLIYCTERGVYPNRYDIADDGENRYILANRPERVLGRQFNYFIAPNNSSWRFLNNRGKAFWDIVDLLKRRGVEYFTE